MRSRNSYRFVILFCLSLLAPQAFAGSIAAELNNTEGDINEPLMLTVTVEGSPDTDLVMPEVAGLVIEQRGTTIRKSLINGQFTSERLTQYLVYAQKPGDYTIPSLGLEVDGKKVQTLPLKLRFSGQANSANSNSGAAANDPNSQTDPNAEVGESAKAAAQAAQKNDSGGVFLERECNKTSPYVGEQVVCAVRVYHLGNLTAAQRVNQASSTFRRFTADGEKRYTKIIGNQRYGVIELREIVIANESGKLEVPPFVLDARVMQMNRQKRAINKLFDQFGGGAFNFDFSFGEEKAVKLTTPPLVFDVKSLPDKDKPTNFSGLVGQFNLETEGSKQTLKTGETFTITAKLSGLGVLDTANVSLPELTQIGKVYPDKPEYKENITDKGVSSSRTLKFALVPSRTGSFPLGTLDIPVFDPEQAAYTHLKADLGTVIVEPGAAEAKPLVVGSLNSGDPATSNQEAVKAISEDLIDIHTDSSLLQSNALLSSDERWRLAVGGGVPLSLALLFFGFDEFKRRRRRDEVSERRSKALSVFREALKANSLQRDDAALGGQGPSNETLSQIEHAFKDFIGHKLNIKGSALTPKEIGAQLRQRQVNEKLTSATTETLEELERIGFGQSSIQNQTSQTTIWLDRLEKLSAELDKSC